MATTPLRIGIAGCGRSARAHLSRLVVLDSVRIVGLADLDLTAAQALATEALPTVEGGPIPAFEDHMELLTRTAPDVLGIFTPHRSHYRLAMDGLQAGCHLFIEKPLTTNAQEAVDIVKLARGRGLVVAVGHQYRLQPSLVEARRRLAEGAIGRLRLVVATMAAPWLEAHGSPADDWRSDPKVSGGGVLADMGDHLLDALLWTTGQSALEVAAFQDRAAPGLDVVNAVVLRLAEGTPATLAISGVAGDHHFEFDYFGERGTLRATDKSLYIGAAGSESIPLPEPAESIDANFATAIHLGQSPCCLAEQALETVRLQEAIARSATSGQVVRLV